MFLPRGLGVVTSGSRMSFRRVIRWPNYMVMAGLLDSAFRLLNFANSSC